MIENKEFASRIEDYEESGRANERIKHFNLEKITFQERILNEQSIKLIKSKNKIRQLKAKTGLDEEAISKLRENISKIKNLYKSVTERVRLSARVVDK